MLHLVLAAVITTAIPPSVQTLIDGLSAQADSNQVDQIQGAIASSATLSEQLGYLARSHRLVAFRIAGSGDHSPGRFGAWQNDGVVYVTPQFLADQANSPKTFDTLDYSKDNPNNLVYSLGHLAHHVQHEAELEVCRQLFHLPPPDAVTNPGTPQPVDRTSALKASVQCA